MARLMTVAFLFVGYSLMYSKDAHAAPVEDQSASRHGLIPQTRNIAQFKGMIECATRKSAWDYNYYGCYCGFGGKGTPVDDTDRCCYIHDHCYQAINDNGICSYPWQIYLDIYDREGCTGCAESNNSCERAICECDGAAARCFAATEKSWDVNYEDWPQGNC